MDKNVNAIGKVWNACFKIRTIFYSLITLRKEMLLIANIKGKVKIS